MYYILSYQEMDNEGLFLSPQDTICTGTTSLSSVIDQAALIASARKRTERHAEAQAWPHHRDPHAQEAWNGPDHPDAVPAQPTSFPSMSSRPCKAGARGLAPSYLRLGLPPSGRPLHIVLVRLSPCILRDQQSPALPVRWVSSKKQVCARVSRQGRWMTIVPSELRTRTQGRRLEWAHFVRQQLPETVGWPVCQRRVIT